MAKISLSIVTPRRQIVETEVDWVEIPAASGQIRVLAGHAPLLGTLGAGVIAFENDGAGRKLVVNGGFVEVLGERVTVLPDVAQFPEEISLAEATAEWEKLRSQPPVAAPAIEADHARRAREFAQARAALASK